MFNQMPLSQVYKSNRDSISYGLLSLASVFTIGRLLFGVLAIVSTFEGGQFVSQTSRMAQATVALDRAACAIFWGVLCDGLDGLVARLTARASVFGTELDSLVDVITFGLAPAFLVMFWGVAPVEHILDARSAQVLTSVGWTVSCGFLVAGVARLARFNVMHEQKRNTRHAVGLAIPCAAAAVAASVHFLKRPPASERGALLWLAFVALLSILMVSRIPYQTLHAVPGILRRPAVVAFMGCLLLAAVWYYSGQLFLVMALAYAISGPLVYVVTSFQMQFL